MISRETLAANRRVLTFGEINPALRTGSDAKPDVEKNHVEGFKSTNPIATCLADQVSANQILLARRLAREIRLNVNDMCRDLFECDFSELSKTAAEEFIERLRNNGASIRQGLNMRFAG